MSDYSLQYPGATIDVLLGKVNNPDSSPTANSDNLVTSGGVKTFVEAITGLLANLNTTAKTNLVAAINEAAQTGAGGLVDITTQEDGTLVFVFSDESTITVDLNHNHPAYPKYELLTDEAEYEALTTKESDTLYLIPE